MIPLIARRTFPYVGQLVTEGQRFLAVSEFDATLFRTIGHAVDVPLDDEPIEIIPIRPRRKRTADPE